MELQLSNIRKEYKKDKLMRNTISENPFEQFACWLNDAFHSGEDEPTAMIVAAVATDGSPSTRTVLLKGVENGRFIFYTNYESRKGQQLADNPYISLSFVWHKLERQIHIEGKAEKCPPKDSDAYFSTRAFVKEAIKLTGQRIQRPGNWGGFAVTPTRFEFWQGRENRLHDRFLYTLCKEEHIPSSSSPESDGWRIVRLAP